MGTIKRFSNQSQYTAIALCSVRSFYNNRSKRVLHLRGLERDAVGACYGADVKKSTTSGWLTNCQGHLPLHCD